MRRVESGRNTLRARPNGEDRRHRRGRRKEDKQNMIKGILSRIFSLQGAGSM